VRLRKDHLRSRVNAPLTLEFSAQGLTSFAGVELLIRFCRSIDLNNRLRRHLDRLPLKGDFGVTGMIRLLLILIMLGGRRIRHIRYLADDPMVLRFCGLKRLPTPRTAGRWLAQFRMPMVSTLAQMNAEVVAESVREMALRTLTLDVDGTVCSTGLQVEWAHRGYNPHQRKVPSYYPITAHLAETGHLLRVQNRPGNVNDGAASIGFLHDLSGQIGETLGEGYLLRYRMDGVFFHPRVLSFLTAQQAGFAIKVPFYKWLHLREMIQQRRHWKRVEPGVEGFLSTVEVPKWGLHLRVAIYRKRVSHRTAKNYQLDLFDPDDGTWEFSAVATNLTFRLTELWRFMCGRGQHEKVIGELKNGFAFDSIPTMKYGGNSAWQQISTLAYNLVLNFQFATGAIEKPRSWKRTARYLIQSIQTLRFTVLNRAGQVLRPQGRTILRLAPVPQTREMIERMAEALTKAA